MSLVELRIFLNGQAASDEQLALLREVRVDQAIGVASEGEIDIDLALGDDGVWSNIDAPFAQAFQRVRVEVRVGAGDYNALIDGPIVAQRFEMSASPGDSAMTLVVHDDSVLLSQTERVALFEDMAAHEIAQALISEGGLTPDVQSVPAAGGAQTRFVVQRGTAMQLLRDLARRNGMYVQVKPGELPGQSVCVFARPSLATDDAAELLLIGSERNVQKFSAQFDALQPLAARAGSVRVSDKQLLDSQSDRPELDPLGDEATHDQVPSGALTLLHDAREEQSDLDAATVAAVDLSSFAYTASVDLDANDYDQSLAPYRVVNVAGTGTQLGGAYLVSRVQHVIGDGNYRQHLTLKRNARSAGGAGAGLLPGGIF